jgi:hypothetical protein
LKRLTWLLLGVYILQADVLIFMRASAPVLSALHPVLALVDFALGLALAWKATVIVRAEETAAPAFPCRRTAFPLTDGLPLSVGALSLHRKDDRKGYFKCRTS